MQEKCTLVWIHVLSEKQLGKNRFDLHIGAQEVLTVLVKFAFICLN